MTQGHTKEIVLGFMSGTSLDGVDAALIETDGVAHIRLGPSASLPFTAEQRAVLRAAVDAAVADPAACVGPEVEIAAKAMTEAHIALGQSLLADIESEWQPSLIGFHGQTILHRPDQGLTYQIGDAAGLAAALGVPVVHDFRSADVTAGGEGAPLAPLYHAALVAAADMPAGPVGVLNLGGVANITVLQSRDVIAREAWDDITAFDTGPASGLLDDWVARHGAGSFDEDGKLAAIGKVDEGRLAVLMDHPYFAKNSPKSLDRHDFSLLAVEGLSLADGAATLTAFTARSVAKGFALVGAKPAQVVATGGGRLNQTMMRMLAEAIGCPVIKAEALGWDGDALEAQAFAYLAKRSRLGLPLSVPGTTGVPGPICGGITVS